MVVYARMEASTATSSTSTTPPLTPSPEWIRKKEAAARLNVTPRAVLDMVNSGKIKKVSKRDPVSHQTIAWFSAGDVERVAYERTNPPEKPAPPEKPPQAQAPATRRQENTVDALALLRSLMTVTPPPMLPQPKKWLTLEEAEEYIGLPRSELREMILAGKLLALDCGRRKGGSFRVRPQDLEAIRGENLHLVYRTVPTAG